MRKLKAMSTLGAAWCHGFINYFEDTNIKRHKKRVQQDRWTMWDIFIYMHDMQGSGWSKGHKSIEGGINIDGGLPTMFKFTYQYYILFFDGTWCITYQISDRKVAGEAFLRPKHCGGAAPPTEQQQISTLQFSPFLSNTGEPALYLIKLKSEQNVNDVPLNWKLGMDLTIEVKDSEQIEKFEPGRTTQITDDILSLVKRILYEVLWYI